MPQERVLPTCRRAAVPASMPSPARHPSGRVQVAVGKTFRGKHIPPPRWTAVRGDACRPSSPRRGRDSGHRTHGLLWPGRECHHGRTGFPAGSRLPVVVWNDCVDLRGGQMQHERRTGRRERLEVLPHWHSARQRRHPSSRSPSCATAGHGEFPAQHSCSGGERRLRRARSRSRCPARQADGIVRAEARCRSTGHPSAGRATSRARRMGFCQTR